MNAQPSFLSWLFGPWGCKNCQAMHRRAQAAESAAAKAIRQNDTTRLWRSVWKLKVRVEYWKRRLRFRQQQDRALWLAQRSTSAQPPAGGKETP